VIPNYKLKHDTAPGVHVSGFERPLKLCELDFDSCENGSIRVA